MSSESWLQSGSELAARGFATFRAVSLWLTGALCSFRGYTCAIVGMLRLRTEAEPRVRKESSGKPEAYRTEGGRAAHHGHGLVHASNLECEAHEEFLPN